VTRRNTSRLVGLLAALARGDEELLGACLFDETHVPFRRKLVPGLEKAMIIGKEAGAAGATISGHGPGVLAFTTDESKAESIGEAMAEVFRDHSVPANMLTLKASTTGSLPDKDGEKPSPGNTAEPPK
jgi:homoserine kinase